MTNHSPVLDQVFRALANPTRREIIDQLGQAPASMTELAAPFEMALPSFLQHLQVLESAGMVSSQKNGRVRIFQLEPQSLLTAEHWMDSHRRQWQTRLDQLDSFLLNLKDQQP